MAMDNTAAKVTGTTQDGLETGTRDLVQRGFQLPLNIVLEVPILGFTVRSLLALAPGSIVETSAQHNDDLMVHANGQLVGMAKFDVTGDVLAVRLTEVL
jgi:flagellar motor switch/type III secretory pathway protein FliN